MSGVSSPYSVAVTPQQPLTDQEIIPLLTHIDQNIDQLSKLSDRKERNKETQDQILAKIQSNLQNTIELTIKAQTLQAQLSRQNLLNSR